MTRAFHKRVRKIEAMIGAAACTCDSPRRPKVAVDFAYPEGWSQLAARNVPGAITRREEDAKRAFTCAMHGRIGATLNVVIRDPCDRRETRSLNHA